MSVTFLCYYICSPSRQQEFSPKYYTTIVSHIDSTEVTNALHPTYLFEDRFLIDDVLPLHIRVLASHHQLEGHWCVVSCGGRLRDLGRSGVGSV